MNTLIPQRKTDEFTVTYIVDEQNKCLGFTVADRNLERVTDKMFKTTSKAFLWAQCNFQGLC